MILLIIGIKEGAQIAAQLSNQGYNVKVLATNALCREQMIASGLEKHLLKEQGTEFIPEILSKIKPQILIDAGTEDKPLIRQMLKNENKPLYIRYFREELKPASSPLIITASTFPDAIDKIVLLKPRTLFLTTGSYGLEQITNDPRLKQIRIVARVLPDWKIIKKCQDYGFNPRDIVALQGPFSVKMNKLLFKTYNADVVISRDSGTMGGLDNKITAALEMKIPIIVVKREPIRDYLNASGYEQLIGLLANIKEE